MRITIDNLDGMGALDYSDWISAAGPLKVQRTLNAPSTCECILDLHSSPLRAPARKGRVTVTSDDGAALFTGYLATAPELVYAGVGTTGPAYRLTLRAISDEWLLDRQSIPRGGARFQQNGEDALRTLTSRVGPSGFTMTRGLSLRRLGVFEPKQPDRWSAAAAEIAGSVYGAYRVVGGAVELQPSGAVSHGLSDGDRSLELGGLRMAETREPANDVTVSGEIEPAAYVWESFAGDGATTVFDLAGVPFGSGSSASSQIISDLFDQGSFDFGVWNVNDPGSHFSLSGAGLSMTGGNGLDGQTALQADGQVEVGGSLLLELGSVQLQPGSDGVLCGLYGGDVSRSGCFAGYNVRQSGGSTVLAALVNGTEQGSIYTLQSGHRYTLRVRVHSMEVQRIRQIYYAMVDGAVKSFGGGAVSAPVDLVFDLQDMGASSNTPATVLFDGRVQSSPATCSFVLADSVQLIGSVGFCRVTRRGTAWVTKTSSAGVRSTQIAGAAGEGVPCTISASGRVTFFPGAVPAPGEVVTVSYRSKQRSIARMEDAASVAADASEGLAGSSQWRGRVERPVARSTADCESAAAALLAVARAASGGLSGSYVAGNIGDIWPGDVLRLERGGDAAEVIVRSVLLEDGMAVPELVTSHVSFATEWAEGFGLKVSPAVALDAALPQEAQTAPANYVPNLQQLTLLSATGTVLQIDTGMAPPSGGGFEVRRRDGGFGAGADGLVQRSPVRTFSIPREAQVERYYVRMYDGSVPPVYSRFSSAVFTDIPVG